MNAPSAPAAAFDKFLREQAPTSRGQRRWTPADGPMPTLYVSHGAPAVFEDALWISELFAWSQALPKPTAILIISAHWESAPLSLSATGANTPLVYDFGGFAQRYFEMTYDTRTPALSPPGSPPRCPTANRSTSTRAVAWTTGRGCR